LFIYNNNFNSQFTELYNETILKKIKKEKKKQAAANCVPLPKISDMFLATSELARHKKKNDIQGINASFD